MEMVYDLIVYICRIDFRFHFTDFRIIRTTSGNPLEYPSWKKMIGAKFAQHNIDLTLARIGRNMIEIVKNNVFPSGADVFLVKIPIFPPPRPFFNQ